MTVLAVATPAAAQSTYVGASLVANVARFTNVDTGDGRSQITDATSSIDGESLGFNVRVGRALGERWGVEFEFARSGEIENSSSQIVSPPIVWPEFTGIPPIPNFGFGIEREQQHTSFGALLWVRQSIGDRLELSYLGGVTFTKTEIEQDFRVTDARLMQRATSLVPNYSVDEHGVGPAVGLEADIKVSESAAITTGVRMQGLNVSGRNGWLVRPLVGLRWRF